MRNRGRFVLIGLIAFGAILFWTGWRAARNDRNAPTNSPATVGASNNPRNASSVLERPTGRSRDAVRKAETSRTDQIELEIKTAYSEWVRLNPEADLYLSLLEKAGTPDECRWRAFLVLSDFCTHLGEFEFDIKNLKHQVVEMRNAVGSENAEGRVEQVKELEEKCQAELKRMAWFKEQVFKNLRRFNPNFTDDELNALVRFRPAESVLSLPRFEPNELYSAY